MIYVSPHQAVLKLRCSCSCRPGSRTPNRRSLHPHLRVSFPYQPGIPSIADLRLRLAGAVDRFCGIADLTPTELDLHPGKRPGVKHPRARPDPVCNICNHHCNRCQRGGGESASPSPSSSSQTAVGGEPLLPPHSPDRKPGEVFSKGTHSAIPQRSPNRRHSSSIGPAGRRRAPERRDRVRREGQERLSVAVARVALGVGVGKVCGGEDIEERGAVDDDRFRLGLDDDPVLPRTPDGRVVGAGTVGEDVGRIKEPVAVSVHAREFRPVVARVPSVLDAVVRVGHRGGGVPGGGGRGSSARVETDARDTVVQTDTLDAVRLAEIALNGMLKASYTPRGISVNSTNSSGPTGNWSKNGLPITIGSIKSWSKVAFGCPASFPISSGNPGY